MKAGTSAIDITPPIGAHLAGHHRHSTGIHDLLYAKSLVLDDGEKSIAIIALDLVTADFEFCNGVRERIRKEIGIETVLIHTTHTHSAPFAVTNAGHLRDFSQDEEEWLASLPDKAVAFVREAATKATTITVKAGREATQVGCNRRLWKDGVMTMDVNTDGVVVPWVDTLLLSDDEAPICILFEHASHPVIVHQASTLISGDYPHHASKSISSGLDSKSLPIFLQGCGADNNGHPLATGHKNAESAGIKLGQAVLKSLNTAESIHSDKLNLASRRIELPCRVVSSDVEKQMEKSFESEFMWWGSLVGDKIREDMFTALHKMKGRHLTIPFEVQTITIGDEWCLTAMTHEMFGACQLWIDRHSPFSHNMVVAYTNGCQSYIATDLDLDAWPAGGYETDIYPCAFFSSPGRQLRPPLKPGAELLIQNAIREAWGEIC